MGTLYLVPTPIGNLGDISRRMADTLAEVDFIAAEDTRVSLKLLNHLEIKKPMLTYHRHNTETGGQAVIDRLLAGENGALVTDAGMPAISDPGEELVARCWELDIPLEVFLERARVNALELQHIRVVNQRVRFMTPLFQRAKVRRAFKGAVLITTSGASGFLLRNFSRSSRLLSLACALAVWGVLSSFVFDVDIRGDSQEAEDGVRQALIGLYGEGPLFGLDADEAEGSLEERLSHQVKWMEVEREGSRMIIRFTSAKHAQSETLRDDDLIAQRDGIIAGFDVQHGEKRVALNQSVKKGDVLVSSLMADSRGNAEHLHVKGRVFAYTWEEVELEAERSAMPQPLQFFSMLLQARAQVSSSFLKDDRIVSENILQFGEKAGKIKLVIHYTLYRDISSPA